METKAELTADRDIAIEIDGVQKTLRMTEAIVLRNQIESALWDAIGNKEEKV